MLSSGPRACQDSCPGYVPACVEMAGLPLQRLIKGRACELQITTRLVFRETVVVTPKQAAFHVALRENGFPLARE